MCLKGDSLSFWSGLAEDTGGQGWDASIVKLGSPSGHIRGNVHSTGSLSFPFFIKYKGIEQ